MIKKLKKSLSVVLVVLMLLTAVPLAGFVGLQFTVSDLNFSAAAADVVASGKCGENVTWTLDSDGVLTISGYGEMYDYNYASEGSAPWIAAHSNVINKVIVEDGVANIGNSAFFYCMNLNEVVLADSVTSIGDSAFNHCSALESITISDSVESIENYAFNFTAYYNNESNWENGALYIGKHLIDVNDEVADDFVVKDGTKTICGDFHYYITSIFVPASVTSIGETVPLKYSELESINVDSNNEYYCSDNGVLYNKDKTTIICYPAVKQGTSFDIPDSVKNIGYSAFKYNTSLTDIVIPDSVESIGAYAFDGCEALENISISDSVTSISRDAFRGTAYYNNENNWDNDTLYIGNHLVNIKTAAMMGFSVANGDYKIKDGTRTIAEDVFFFAGIESITIPGSVETIGEIAFYMCSILKNITIENGVESIGLGAFSYCKSLENITIPESVESVGYGAFYVCTSLESITILNPECEIAEGPEDEADELYGALTIPENTVIYGYKDSTAQKYAEKYGNTFIALDGEDTTVEINISDNENSGIQFDFSEDTFDDSQGTVTLEIRRDTTQSQYLLTDFSKVTAWNMTFYNEAGEEIQPKTPVTVKMPIPEDYSSNFLMLLHIDPQTNQGSMVDFAVEDGFVVFEASSFSVYALVDTSSEIEDEPTVEPDVPNDEPDEPDVPDEPAAPTCDHLCHKSGFVGVIWKIVRFFWKLFNMNPVCECGAAHY